jgi:hypothetical protein
MSARRGASSGRAGPDPDSRRWRGRPGPGAHAGIIGARAIVSNVASPRGGGIIPGSTGWRRRRRPAAWPSSTPTSARPTPRAEPAGHRRGARRAEPRAPDPAGSPVAHAHDLGRDTGARAPVHRGSLGRLVALVNSRDDRSPPSNTPSGGPARGRRAMPPPPRIPPESMVTLTWDLRTLSDEELWALRPLAERALEGSPSGTAPRPVGTGYRAELVTARQRSRARGHRYVRSRRLSRPVVSVSTLAWWGRRPAWTPVRATPRMPRPTRSPPIQN